MNAREFRRWLQEQGCTFHTHKGGSGHLTVPARRPHQPAADARRPQGGSDEDSLAKIKKDLGLDWMLAYPISLEDDDGTVLGDVSRLPGTDHLRRGPR